MLKVENKALKKEIQRIDKSRGDRPSGTSRSWREVVKGADTVAPTESTVLRFLRQHLFSGADELWMSGDYAEFKPVGTLVFLEAY